MVFLIFLYYLSVNSDKIKENKEYSNSIFNSVLFFIERKDVNFLRTFDNPMQITKTNFNRDESENIVQIVVPDKYASMDYDEYIYEVYKFKNWLMTGVNEIRRKRDRGENREHNAT